MSVHPSDIIIGLMMMGFSLLGLLLGARALDLEMEVFGLSLTAFSFAFLIGQINRCTRPARVAVAALGSPRRG